jgi:hypothetical protein
MSNGPEQPQDQQQTGKQEEDVFVVDSTEFEQMTMSERRKYADELRKNVKTFILNGQKYDFSIRQAGNINLGSAKPDDPIYKEGWTISPGGLRGQSRKPTNSTPPQPDSQAPPRPAEQDHS